MDRTQSNRQDGSDGLPPRRPEDNDAVDDGEERSDFAPRQGGERGRGGGPGRAARMNTISEEPPLTGHDQGQDTANTAETTPSRLERRAAEIRDFNRRRRARGHTNSDTSGNTPYTQGVGRPLERIESSLDPSMNRTRSNAISSSFATRPEDVERERANLERRAWIAAGRNSGPMEERERNRFNRRPTTYQFRAHEGFPPNGTGTRGLYAGQYPIPYMNPATGRAAVGTGGYTPFGSDNFHSSVPDQSSPRDDDGSAAVYDPGSFEDTDQFYVEPASKPENVDPKAVTSQLEGKPGGDSNPPKRKDEPDDKQSGGRGPGASGQAT
ncbi:uncharacterized protein J4E88_004703 [Alternaria novae-zelandiae]|uniref:uncharacterized protein n=1 Tax=Alternaria novae-zelandiae TaxID=430562 RepID=UPI0020C2A173|nr:uncharacterized protein J4E88_004703 [Alternaria novae-zelandiae]KAI4683527.1 hypothetical protein J4E88_004703 [Alternaria novae-zelandiae]